MTAPDVEAFTLVIMPTSMIDRFGADLALGGLKLVLEPRHNPDGQELPNMTIFPSSAVLRPNVDNDVKVTVSMVSTLATALLLAVGGWWFDTGLTLGGGLVFSTWVTSALVHHLPLARRRRKLLGKLIERGY